MRLVTFFGYLSIPATKQCGYFRPFFDASSTGFTITAFLPARLPANSTTTLPGFRLPAQLTPLTT
jgi:hypothetical protein